MAMTPAAGYTGNNTASTSTQSLYKLSGTTSESPGATFGASTGWTVVAAAFNLAGGSPPPNGGFFSLMVKR